MKFSIASILALLSACVSGHSLTQIGRFYDWSLEYDINFKDGMEFENRFHIWTKNDHLISKHNAQCASNYNLEHNQFSHLLKDEKNHGFYPKIAHEVEDGTSTMTISNPVFSFSRYCNAS